MKNEIVIRKMLGYAEKIIGYCEDCDYQSFAADSKLVEACVFNLSQLGELCRLAGEDYAAAHPQVPWREMYGLRNRIVHDYEGVNMRLVWEIISEDMPGLVSVLRDLL